MTTQAQNKLLKAKKTRPLIDLSGKDMVATFGTDLSNGCFACANLRDTNWTGLENTENLDLRCADLTGANMPNQITRGWNCTGAKMSNVVLDGTTISAVMHGVLLDGASMKNITWNRGGHAGARGVILPEHVDFSTWENGRGFHAGIAKLLEQEHPNDPEVLRVCDYILGQSQRQFYQDQFPCWKGLVMMCRKELSQGATDRIYETFSRYPKMRLKAMWDVTERELGTKKPKDKP